jgi:hypothetical protein
MVKMYKLTQSNIKRSSKIPKIIQGSFEADDRDIVRYVTLLGLQDYILIGKMDDSREQNAGFSQIEDAIKKQQLENVKSFIHEIFIGNSNKEISEKKEFILGLCQDLEQKLITVQGGGIIPGDLIADIANITEALNQTVVGILVKNGIDKQTAEKMYEILVQPGGEDRGNVPIFGTLETAITKQQTNACNRMDFIVNLGAREVINKKQKIFTNEGNHWITVSVVLDGVLDGFKISVLYEDSLGNPPKDNFLRQLQRTNEIHIAWVSVRQQYDGHNCGRYALLNCQRHQDYSNKDVENLAYGRTPDGLSLSSRSTASRNNATLRTKKEETQAEEEIESKVDNEKSQNEDKVEIDKTTQQSFLMRLVRFVIGIPKGAIRFIKKTAKGVINFVFGISSTNMKTPIANPHAETIERNGLTQESSEFRTRELERTNREQTTGIEVD